MEQRRRTMETGNEFTAPLGELFGELAAYTEPLEDDELGVRFTVERVVLDMPFEMDVNLDEADGVALSGAPPTQIIETTFFPVLHRLKMTVEVE
jgi:hypothetical protein